MKITKELIDSHTLVVISNVNTNFRVFSKGMDSYFVFFESKGTLRSVRRRHSEQMPFFSDSDHRFCTVDEVMRFMSLNMAVIE